MSSSSSSLVVVVDECLVHDFFFCSLQCEIKCLVRYYIPPEKYQLSYRGNIHRKQKKQKKKNKNKKTKKKKKER